MSPTARLRTGLKFEVWAQLFLSDGDCAKVWDVLISKCGIKRKALVKRMHITAYHARRPMRLVTAGVEPVNVVIPTIDTRFMVLAPGGENPKPYLEPAKHKVGIRVQRKNIARAEILRLRERMLVCETSEVLGNRRPSTNIHNAFGARYFQPHMALLRAGSGIDRDLTKLGAIFRDEVSSLTFDKFCVEVVSHDASGSRIVL